MVTIKTIVGIVAICGALMAAIFHGFGRGIETSRRDRRVTSDLSMDRLYLAAALLLAAVGMTLLVR